MDKAEMNITTWHCAVDVTSDRNSVELELANQMKFINSLRDSHPDNIMQIDELENLMATIRSQIIPDQF